MEAPSLGQRPFFLQLEEEKREGKVCVQRHDGDATSPLAGTEAIIQLVKVSGRVTAHKTNMIATTNYREWRAIRGQGFLNPADELTTAR